jgi:amino acid transporter
MLKPEYNRYSNHYKRNTFLDWLQPIPAWIGLIGCGLIFGFASATWWDSGATVTKVATAYAAVHIAFLFFSTVVSPHMSANSWIAHCPFRSLHPP